MKVEILFFQSLELEESLSGLMLDLLECGTIALLLELDIGGTRFDEGTLSEDGATSLLC